MEIGTEISQKIRSAIKAKLIEQGAYVDDELPDYIMVMVANKKSQKQMTEDLSLFLGGNTDKFTIWLHGLLKKLQSINTDEAGGKHKSKERDKHRGEKRKHKTSQGEKEKTTEGEKQRKLSSGEKEKIEKKKPEEKAETSTAKVKPVQQIEDEQHEEIEISENTDEFNEENKEAEMNEQVKSTSTGKPPPTKAAKSDKSADVKKSSTKTSTRDSSKSKSSAASKHKSESKEPKKPTSFVASVKRRYEELDEEEEYDPANPAVGSVASVVRGPQRKSSVPKSLQANKSLLMKAVTEAEKSVTTSKKIESTTESKPSMRSDRQPVDLKKRLKTPAGIGLLSRSKRTELEALKYRVETEPSKDTAKKPRRSSEGFENMKYTIRNETVSRSKSPPKKTPPKAKAPAVAPSRVAASAFREMGHVSKVVVKKESKEVASDAEDEGSDDNSADIDRNNSEDSVSASEAEDTDSGEEVEIEVTDRAAQTVVNMRDKNFKLADTQGSSDKDCQTEVREIGSGESSSYKLSKDKMEEIDNSLLNLFIENLLPFEFVENEPFRMFAKTLEPKYHFPKRKKLMTEVGMLYNSVKDLMKSEMAGNQSIIFTHNSWSSMEGETYDTLTAHYINKDWKLRSSVLKTSEISTHDHCESIAEHLDETRMKWNLPEPVLVTDDSNTEHRVVKMLGWKRVLCFGCCIHTVIRRSLKERDISHFIEQGRKLITEVLGNSAVIEMLEKKKKLLLSEEVQNKCLVLDIGQNWRSTLTMLACLGEQTPALHAAIMDSELTNQGVDLRMMLYTFSQQSSVETLVKILNTFKTAAEILTNSESPTLQKVIPIFIKLDKVLEADNDDNTMIRNMKSDIKHEIKHFLDNSKETCLLACLVHPQTKQMAFVSQKEKEDIKSLLFHEVKAQCEKEFRENQDDESKFKKGKKGNVRQTKAMSEMLENTDVRRVVVNKESEDNGAHDGAAEYDKDNVESTDGEVTEDEDGDTSDMGDGNRNKNRGTETNHEVNQQAGPSGVGSGDFQTDSDGKSTARNVRTPFSDADSKLQMTNLSITVENDWLDDVICASDDQRSPEETAKIELNLYMAEPASNKNPLAWWQEKLLLYPHIANIAKRVLAIPASSLNAEDIFSLERKKDCKSLQIKAEHIDMMLFLKQNKELYETE
ncbi:uncharacterized protein LOC123523941 [Mercenaria mercenaria]|uniref:uncharacterized protein LOC123523941 n=1 Tax=Mercenaria mercenaria TaxID=6596 RepID=UPI00234E576D|nr:uncharacterized protein LOC123523941 [Mercenaria mercenaria]